MAHPAQVHYCLSVKNRYPQHFKNVSVCDLGSLDINGNNRYLFNEYTYVGVDIGAGRNVTTICSSHEYAPVSDKYDVVVSTECLEHNKYWRETLLNVTNNLLKDGGLFLMSCATTGRAEHGTTRSDVGSSPFTNDYYLNLTEADFRSVLNVDEIFSSYEFVVRDTDLYFYGILKKK